MTTPPVCDYEGSDYQTSFWDQGGRQYEDQAEAIALAKLLPAEGSLMLELGAGAGRNTPRYAGYRRIVLLDYSRTQLQQARERLGDSERYIFVAADVYKLPFMNQLFDGATMIRTLHHMQSAPKALEQVKRVLQPGAVFILEFANKHNLKAILRYRLGKQAWDPNDLKPIEFAALNFDFHPRAIFKWLEDLDMQIQKVLSVSHFRIGFIKRLLPAGLLSRLDGMLQGTGSWLQVSPSIFLRAQVKTGSAVIENPHQLDVLEMLACPECGAHPLQKQADHLLCGGCGRKWAVRDGIYDFREPIA